MTQRRAGATALLAVTLLAAGCGGSATSAPPDTSPPAGAGECDWPMWGHNPARTFAYPCDTMLSDDTVGDLVQVWFFNTDDVVTASPAVVESTAYVGDWSGRFYALDTETGQPRWTFQAATEPNVYAGQIVSSAAVSEVDGRRLVVFGSGRTLHALDADDGSPVWEFATGTADEQDFTEIESSPVIVDGLVLFGTDVHNQPDQPAGLFALDVTTGEQRWFFDPDQGGPHLGCADVWSSPSVDVDRRLVFFGTANCPAAPDGWGPYTEAIVAVDLDSGEPRWSFQPHDPNNDDLDFAGAPNLFRADNRDLVGLGNKDGTYYAVDRDSGELAWKTAATEPGLEEPGSNFSTGGFIGPSAYASGIVVGTTAVGPPPYLHAMSTVDGDLLWQDEGVQASYAPSAIANGVVFTGGNDFTLRAYRLESGDVLWEHEMQGVVAGGPVVVGSDLFAVAGIREPGLDARSETSGVYRFSLRTGSSASSAPTSTSTPSPRATGVVLEPNDSTCVGAPCDLFEAGITLRPAPAGLDPTASLEITTDPFRVTIRATGLGQPTDWLQPGSEAAAAGAEVFGLFISERDDNPIGGVLCILEPIDDGPGGDGPVDIQGCTTDSLPARVPYNRITLLALENATAAPTLSDGPARLLVTTSFDPPLTPVGS